MNRDQEQDKRNRAAESGWRPGESEPEEKREKEDEAQAGKEDPDREEPAGRADPDKGGEEAEPGRPEEKERREAPERAPREEADAPKKAEGGAQNNEDAALQEEVRQLKAELIAARSQLAAYAAGVLPEMAQDAVTLATAQARAEGEPTEETVKRAMDDVLKRHPDWKTADGKKAGGGFKLGADPDGRSTKKEKAEPGSKKPWNKFNRAQKEE